MTGADIMVQQRLRTGIERVIRVSRVGYKSYSGILASRFSSNIAPHADAVPSRALCYYSTDFIHRHLREDTVTLAVPLTSLVVCFIAVTDVVIL